MAETTVGIQYLSTTSWQDVGNGSSNTIVVGGDPFIVPAGADGFVVRLGARVRRQNGVAAARIRMLLYAPSTTNPNEPGALLGHTDRLDVTAGNGSTTGQDLFGTVTFPAGRKPVLRAGARFFVGFVVQQGTNFGGIQVMRDTTRPVISHYRRETNDANPIPSTFVSAATTATNTIGVYVVTETGTAPSVAITGPPSVVSTPTPSLTATVSDPDRVAHGDSPAFVYAWVRRYGETTYVWQMSRAATIDEINGGPITVPYAGAALASGYLYEWTLRVADRTGQVSSQPAWSVFEVSGVGNVDISASVPDTKLESGVVPSWGGRWNHPAGLSMTTARVLLYDDQGRLISSGNEVAVAALNNALFTVTPAAIGFGGASTPLAPGAYKYEVLGKDSSGVWSLNDGPLRDFSVNSPPSIPVPVNPPSGTVQSTRPRLEWILSDPDPDDTIGFGVDATVRIFRPGNPVPFDYGGIVDVDPLTGVMFLQTTATHLPTHGTYTWEVIGRDISAGTSTMWSQDWSTRQTIIFQPAPQPTSVSPAAGAVLTTRKPLFQWSVNSGPQDYFELKLYRRGAANPFFSTGRQPATGSGGSYTLPDNWVSNKQDYDYILTFYSGALSGSTPRTPFRVQYIPSETIFGLQGSLVAKQHDWEPTTPLLSWDITRLPLHRFEAYVVYHRFEGQEFRDAVPIAKIRQVNQTRFLHHDAYPNRTMIYSVTQLEDENGQIRESDPTDVVIETTLTVPTLTALEDPTRLHAALRSIESGYGGGFSRPQQTYQTWGTGGAPTVIQAPKGYGQKRRSVSVTIIGENRQGDYVPMLKLAEELFEVATATGVLVARFPDGERLYCVQGSGTDWAMGGIQGTRTMKLSLEEVAYNEAVRLPK